MVYVHSILDLDFFFSNIKFSLNSLYRTFNLENFSLSIKLSPNVFYRIFEFYIWGKKFLK